MKMRATIRSKELQGERWYKGAEIALPADQNTIEDAMQRAQVSELDEAAYDISMFKGWPDFLKECLLSCGQKTIQEVNVLAWKASQMDETQLETLEGAVKLRMEEDCENPISMRELINLSYNLDCYDYYHGIVDDRQLGEVCMEGEMLDLLDGLPDEVLELIDLQKAGQEMRRMDCGTFTGRGYIFRNHAAFQEVYDGICLPETVKGHWGSISLRLASAERMEEEGIWLELPATEERMRQALKALGEPGFDSCCIVETKSCIPALEYQLAGDEDIRKLNELARRIQAFPDSRTLVKYKAVLQYEQCWDLDMALDLAANLECYAFDPMILSCGAYAEYVLKEVGINTNDPAFAQFDFQGYGKRLFEENGFASTSYGTVARTDEPFRHEYTEGQEVVEPCQDRRICGMEME